MTSGGPQDHPITDILNYGIRVYSAKADALVAELARLMSTDRLYELTDWWAPGPIDDFTDRLRILRDEALEDARQRGWDV